MLLDDSGWEHQVTLETVSPKHVMGVVTNRLQTRGEPSTKITLYQGVLKSDRFEFVLQKGTELGVSGFVPTFCSRSIPTPRGREWGVSRQARWRKIITEAAEQSGRGRIPTLREPTGFLRACDQVQGLAIIPWEREGGTGLRAALARLKAKGCGGVPISVFIGPEGGFTQEEIDYARARGIVSVSLGNRTLRSETAGIVATTAILYELGELGV